MPRTAAFGLLFAALLFAAAGCASSSETAVVTERPQTTLPVPTTPVASAPVDLTPMPAGFDTVKARRFDTGKMWTFDNPPVDYFQEAYGFRPDPSWFERARLGALRFATYCSASFVSPNGLIMTNHHCGRESITEVSGEGENLLDNGFYASGLSDERKVKDLFVEQLLMITDVSDEVLNAVRNITDDDARAEVLGNKVEEIQERMTKEAKARDSSMTVQVIELYNGGRYSAYTFKRYNDVRLVMAPELQLGYFGGDPDNFTYPRYALDMSFFRAYGSDGKPLQTSQYFKWSPGGAGEGEPVFMIGNPGSTSRLNTVAELEYERDFSLPQQLDIFRRRSAILHEYIQTNPEGARQYKLENAWFDLENTIKSSAGMLRGLRDPYLIARRAAAERDLQTAINGTDSLRTPYGRVLNDIRELQGSKEATALQSAALLGFDSPMIESHILVRALYGYAYALLRQRGAPQEQLSSIRKEAAGIENWPPEVERAFITARLQSLERAFGAGDPTLRRILQGQTPDTVAARLVAGSALIDSTRYLQLLDKGFLSSNDPVLPVIEAIAPLYFSLSQQAQNIQAREQNLNAQLARARFALYGTRIPPDATFSLRIADGVVKGYTYNGTVAPVHTTFYGLYARYYEHGDDTPWDLPERWLKAPASFDRSTPFNMISTNDITGGNSGSALLNRNLEVVGLVFDSNIEGLPNQYLFWDDAPRAVAVHSRGILETLDDVYDADRMVLELTTGRLVPTEAEADQVSTQP